MDNLNLTYRQFHETFMQNHNGTSIEETVIIQSPIPFATFISVFVIYLFKRHELSFVSSKIVQFILEFFVMIVSQIFTYVLSEYNIYLHAFVYGAGIYSIFVIVFRYRNEINKSSKTVTSLRNVTFSGKRDYITCFRTSVLLSTTICILAVDFQSFPRVLAKTETFGFSLMDLGVGYFIVCSALVGWHGTETAKQEENFLWVQLKRNFPLLVLGLMRIFFTKSVNYQNHSSEYGVHWNFFLTLTFVRFFSTFLLRYTPVHRVKYLAVFIITFHQCVLSSGVQEWVMGDTPRDNFIHANREGIVSISGYVGLYLLSFEVRNRMLSKVSTFEKEVKLLLSTVVVTIMLYPTVLFLAYYLPCSRRLVNVTYIVWVIMLSLYFLSLSLFFELCFALLNGRDSTDYTSECCVPLILKSINFNALPHFLLANLLTGIINLSFETLRLSNTFSMCILTLYMFVSSSVITFLYCRNYKIL